MEENYLYIDRNNVDQNKLNIDLASSHLKPRMYIMCGLPGAGKTTFANQLFEFYQKNGKEIVLVATDDIRKEILGDEKDLSQQDLIFQIAFQRIGDSLNKGIDVIFDAMNITIFARMEIIELFEEKCELICMVLNTPVDQCISNQYKRDRRVPESVIEKMNNRFTLPGKQEGWDKIYVIKL